MPRGKEGLTLAGHRGGGVLYDRKVKKAVPGRNGSTRKGPVAGGCTALFEEQEVGRPGWWPGQ